MLHQRTQLPNKFAAHNFLLSILFVTIFGINVAEIIKISNKYVATFNNGLTQYKDLLTPQELDTLATSSEFSNYSIIHPKILHGYNKAVLQNTLDIENGQHISYIILTFYHNGKPIYIDLKLNEELLPEQHFLRFQNSKVKSKYTVKNITKTESELCHYQGSIRGKPTSRVAVSTCNGDINGIVIDSNDAYIIHAENNGTLKSRHFLFRASDLRQKNATCGHKNDDSDVFLNPLSIMRHKRSSDNENSRHDPFKANKHSFYVELVIVVDNGVFKFFEEHMEKVHQYCKDVANIMNALYAPLNIFVILTGVVVWNERDEIDFDNEARETLLRFLEYRLTKLSPEHPNDHAQLLTKHHFNDNVVGKAFVGPMCTEEKSGAVCVIHSPIPVVVANTMAHEMGHVFGMSHDVNGKCKCPDKKCIMSDTSSAYIPTHWSRCSIDNLTRAFSLISHCLRNKPAKLFTSSMCGNGFVEAGEECDCGLPGFCVSNCCDPQTCRLYSNATCGSGECCDMESCRLKAAGTTCRIADTECDLSEFCTGRSEFCPKDVYKQDTMECGNGAGHCYQGKCGSHEGQCRILWGTAAVNSEHCYSTTNKRGDNTGNCGLNLMTKEFIKCEEEDVRCGKLQCSHPRNWKKFGIVTEARTWTSYAFYNRNYVECRSALFDLGLHTPDPGMTPNGAKCGVGKMCIAQKCVIVEELRSQGLGRYCKENCSGNGVCNSRGNCHCDIGFAGSACQAPGPGGSIDSGPATNPNSHDAFLRFLYIFFCGVIPFVISFYALVFLYRKHPFFKRNKKQLIKNVNSPITEVVYASTNSKLLNSLENNISAEQQLLGPMAIAKSTEELGPSTSSDSIDPKNFAKVHKSIENLTKSYGNSSISKSASNYELSTVCNTSIIPPGAKRKPMTPAIAKKSYKSVNALAGRSVQSSNDTLRSKLEITDVRLQSSTNPLAVALVHGVTLIGNKDSNTELNSAEISSSFRNELQES